MTALIDRVGAEVDAIDVFCGYGGSSQGIHAAGATVRAAANHNALAIECHAANFPDVEHWQCDMVDANDPQVINRAGKKVAGMYLDPEKLPAARFAWFSPGCTHHSQANATKQYEQGRQLSILDDDDFDPVAYANSERSRVTMSCVIRYARRHHPEILCVENVVEVTKWGPGRDGSTFAWWMHELRQLDYEVECCFLNSMFFAPCPQSRDRIYIVAWRKGNPKPDLDYRPRAYCTSQLCGGKRVNAVQVFKAPTRAWPLPRWGKYRDQYNYRCPECSAIVEPAAWPALSVIDWSNLGASLAERRDSGDYPADNTVERIKKGYSKLGNGPAIVLPAKSTWGVDRSVCEPLTTQTSQQEKALATFARTGGAGENGIGMIVKANGDRSETGYRSKSAGEPLGAVTSSPTQQLAVAPATIPLAGNTFERAGKSRARSVVLPAPTIHTTQALGMSTLIEMRGGGSVESGQHSVAQPAHAVTAGGMHHLLATAAFSKINGGPDDTTWHHPSESLNTVTGRDTHGLIIVPWIEQWISDPIAVTDQLATVMSHLRHSLASIEPIPMDEITDDVLDSIRFRMLEPDPELRGAMAFGADYILLGNKTQQTAGLGNAVTPPVSAWVTGQCLVTLR